MRIISDIKLDFSDVLLVPHHSTIGSRKEVTLDRDFKFKYSPHIWEGVPIISSNMESVTTPEVARVMLAHRMMACTPKLRPVILGKFFGGLIPSFGINDFEAIKSDDIYRFICLDVANGYMEKFVDLIKKTRQAHPNLVIIVGNVVTPEMVTSLILAGADIVKVGIGSGAACATRMKTGVGYPQLSAIIECADAAHGLGGHIISDGGCTCAGDVVKAFAAGADFVMLGSMLAGHVENGVWFKGEASKAVVEASYGGLKEYRAVEGWELELPSKGKLEDTLQDILGGLRSACSYVGARKIKDLPKCATFVQVNRQLNTSLWDYRT